MSGQLFCYMTFLQFFVPTTKRTTENDRKSLTIARFTIYIVL